jgi:hypothetical protein
VAPKLTEVCKSKSIKNRIMKKIVIEKSKRGEKKGPQKGPSDDRE